jgi:hypothetical protein
MTYLVILFLFAVFVVLDVTSSRLTEKMLRRIALARMPGAHRHLLYAALIRCGMVELPLITAALYLSAIGVMSALCIVLIAATLRYLMLVTGVAEIVLGRFALSVALGAILLFGLWLPTIKAVSEMGA